MKKMKLFLLSTLIMCAALGMCVACGKKTDVDGSESSDTQATEDEISTADTEGTEDTEVDSSGADGKVHYTVKVVDQEGNPVAGAMVQLCNESCFPGKTDEDGIAEFSLEESEYKVSFLTLPEGYTYSGEETAFYFEDGKEEITIELKSISSEETEEDTEDNTEEAQNESSAASSESQSQAETQPQQQPSQSQPQQPSSSSGQTTEQTTAANGEAGTTHLEFPDSNFSLTTVEIAAGKSVYYDIYRVAGMLMEINAPDAYVVYNGVKYAPQNGVVRLQVDQGLASDAVRFEIGNSGSSKKSFKLQFSYIYGTYGNPEVITAISGNHSAYSAAGNDVGYFYTYTAEKTGTLVLYVSSVTSSKNATAGISVTNENTYANRTTDADGSDDGKGHIKIEIAVTKGDPLQIVVAVEPTATWEYPEATITWVGEYK